jgi:phenylacetate-coenzyme A ligase PaaK-like adenylate-forming protein
MPWPRRVPVSDAAEVARWLELKARTGRPALVETTASSAVRVCSAALAAGLDISDTFFRLGGEPYTSSKAAVVAAAGCRAIAHYSMNEVARAGVACAAPSSVDDVHVVTDKLAVIRHEREIGGRQIGSLLLTTLLSSSPKLMLNVECDDHGVLERRHCGCPVGEAGFDLHLHTIRSVEKLTSEGMNFLRDEILEVVEHVLPSRFGGSPTDYQVVEREVDGLPRVSIVVSPGVGALDEAQVIRVALDALGAGPGYRSMMAGIWAEGETLRVERREPYATSSAKILPLHVLDGSSETWESS